jgi:hypothetical protein
MSPLGTWSHVRLRAVRVAVEEVAEDDVRVGPLAVLGDDRGDARGHDAPEKKRESTVFTEDTDSKPESKDYSTGFSVF